MILSNRKIRTLGRIYTGVLSRPHVHANHPRGCGSVAGPISSVKSVFEIVPIRESLRLQFRPELFNALKNPNFSGPVANIGTGTVGTILSVSRDYHAVYAFLAQHPELVPVLVDAHPRILTIFGTGTTISLSVLSEPTAPRSTELFALIPTTLAVEQALAKLSRFDEEWWLAAPEQQKANLNFDIEFR